MNLECKIINQNNQKFLYRRFDDKIYWSNANSPDKLLKTKNYTCGNIEREDFVRKSKSIIPYKFSGDESREFSIIENKFKVSGKQFRDGSFDVIENIVFPVKKRDWEQSLSPLAKKYLAKVTEYLKAL